MGYSISIDNLNKIIIYKHNGYVNLAEIGRAWNDILKIHEFIDEDYNLLSDYRNAELDLSIKEFSLISIFFIKYKEILKNKKQSLIITDPLTTAKSILFEEEVKSKVDFQIKIFSTYESALNWLKYK